MANEVAVVKQENEVVKNNSGVFSSEQNFELAQRKAKALSASDLVPECYRGNMPNCLIALEMSERIGASPLAVMQNLYIVHGRPAWSSQFLISCINASGKFSPLRYMMTGEKGKDTWGCIAWVIDKSGERLESPEITISISKAEGWFAKNGSKWKTMPDLMLRYRAATLLARLYAPELTMGIQTDDEVIDITPIVTEPVKVSQFEQKPIIAKAEVLDSMFEQKSLDEVLKEFNTPVILSEVKQMLASKGMDFNEAEFRKDPKPFIKDTLEFLG